MKYHLSALNCSLGLLLVIALAPVTSVNAQESADELDALFGPSAQSDSR